MHQAGAVILLAVPARLHTPPGRYRFHSLKGREGLPMKPRWFRV